jgi:putative spermidine/putrescine transport system ATP-binding protein
MSNGVLEQIDTPDVLYNAPATAFVANFVGVMNRIPANLADGKVNIFGKNLVASRKGSETGKIVALLRPETILVKKSENQGNAKVLTRSFLGASSAIICQTHEGTIVQSLMASLNTGEFQPGTSVDLEVTVNEVMVANG